MQCGEVMYHSFPTMTKGSNGPRPEKETIHSGHFMVSHFEDEAQDDEVDLAVPLPEVVDPDTKVTVFGAVVSGGFSDVQTVTNKEDQTQQQISIDNSLDKLFQCMTLAYRQKLTSPKWNRFKGIKLLWKDKIRLNNVIWRCWHMQFILKQNTLVCQFASPLDVDTHIKPETTILEGKYWKRRAEAVTAEYKKWRMFYKNRALGWGSKDVTDVIPDMEVLDWQSQGDSSHMLDDEDYIDFMSDTLFSTITSNQPFAFPDTREIARGASLADFIQPSLGPLQPNLEDFMDTLEPLQDLLSGSKLAPVPEEIPDENSVYKNSIPPSYMDQSIQNINQQSVNYSNPQMQTTHLNQQQHQLSAEMRPEATSNMILKQGTLTNDLTLNQNTCLDNNQHNTNMLVRQNHSYIPHGGGQMLNQSNTTNPMLQQQSMMMQQQQQGFNIAPRNILNQSQNINTSLMLQTQQNVAMMTNNPQQQQMQKSQAQFMQQNHKPYNRMPMGSYQDRNYNMRQGQHQQTQNENNVYMNRVRTNSAGAIAYPMERRSRPIAPAPSQNFVQFMGAPQNLVDTKPSYAEQNHQMNIKGHIFVGSHVDQNMSGNLSMANNMRFKVPSPPPQVPVTSQMRGQPMTQHKKKQTKMENFRSNSLPLGVSLASVMGITSTASGTTVVETVTPSKSNRGRRPRSGSSSPSPQQRRGPAPLVSTASEPLLKDTSVLLAHLLNSKGQPYFKPNNIPSIPKDLGQASGSQPHPVAIIKSSLVNQMPSTIVTTTSKIVPFGSNSPTSQPSPSSPLSPGGCEGRSCGSGGEHRRAGHIHAEQKRRYNIKNGFDLLQSLIPQFSQNPKSKVSKAAMLQKGAEYIKQLQAERNLMKEDIDNLKQQIESLINALSNCQSLLPATGVNVSRQRSGRLKEMFDDYVRERTQENWKFWIFSLLVEPLLHSYNNSVSPSSTEELKRSTYLWAEQHCSLVEMRPAALSAMRTLSTNTEILSDPSRLPEEARAAVETKRRNSLNNQIKK